MLPYTGIGRGQACIVSFCGYHRGGGRHKFEGGLPDCVLVIVIGCTIFPNLSLEETSCTTVPCYEVSPVVQTLAWGPGYLFLLCLDDLLRDTFAIQLLFRPCGEGKVARGSTYGMIGM